ncbi:MAG: TatD family hydrolase [Proteobacteria bacterium]|nr:TatD family hydrolase [Cystobacterineae bacterium]MCL2259421.1 TatD family hydrolase [Cystobacterineae bacterium]MCL2314132.1 TatD family hydrolase [Pseudomonadota bacterium]
MRLFDSHCHLDSELLQEPCATLLERAHRVGVCEFLLPAVTPKQWPTLSCWPQQYPQCHVALGLHPSALPGLQTDQKYPLMQYLETLLPLACAVGECGLDKRLTKTVPMEKQIEWFSAQVLLAKKHGRPLVVHCQGAYGTLLELLSQYAPLPAGFVLHSFSGSLETLKAFSQLGGYFSYSGNICHPLAKKATTALQHTPLQRLLLETDSPFQSPLPPQPNEPAFLTVVLQKASTLLSLPPEELAHLTTLNAQRLFSLPAPP